MNRGYDHILKRYDKKMAETARKTAEMLHQGELHADGADRKEAPEALVYAVMPGLSYYVEWVLKQAQADGVRRLYFLARDGYLMYRMASELCMSRKISVECRYLYGSRYAWRIPWYHLDWDGCLEKLCLDGLDVSFLSITERAGMDRKEARRQASRYWPETADAADRLEERMRERIPRAELRVWKERLRTDREFRESVEKISREAYESTLHYLRQEGLFEKIRYGLVDSGWVGSIQVTLERLLASAGCTAKPEGYYYGLYDLPEGADTARYHAFYFSPRRGLKNKVCFNNCLYECIFSSPEESCRGYVWQEGEETENGERKKGFWRPVTGREGDEEERLEEGGKASSDGNPNRERILVTEKVLEAWMKEYQERQGTDRGETDGNLREISEKRNLRCQRALWKRLMCRPDAREAEYFGGYLFSDDVGGKEEKRAAERLLDEELKGLHVGRRLLGMAGVGKREQRKGSAWMEGSIVRNGRHVKRELWNETVHKWLLYGGKELAVRMRWGKRMRQQKDCLRMSGRQ